jgi:hypothetical protein
LHDHFETLLDRLGRLIEVAGALASPNGCDDLCSKGAIVGYSYLQPSEAWSYEHVCLLQARREDFGTWAEAGETSDICSFFSCVCFGYLLGLVDSGRGAPSFLLEGEVALAWFVAANLGRIQSTPFPPT